MADYLSPSAPGNFSNPAYASPEQLKAQRDYAAELLRRSTEGATRPTGVAAAMIDALTSNIYRNNADRLQSQAAQGNAADTAAIAAQLQSGQPLNAQTLGHLYANPMASPEARGLVQHLIQPQPITSPYGQPGYVSPNAGASAPRLPGNYAVGAPYSQGVEGASQSGLAPPPASAPPPARQGSAFGGMKSKPAGWDQGNVPPPVATPPGTVPAAPGQAPVGYSAGGYAGPMTLDQLAAKGRELSARKGIAESQTGVAKQDFEAAAIAPNVMRVADTMAGDLKNMPLNMGPTSESVTNAQKIIRQHLPGLMSEEEIKNLAGNDLYQKSAAQLLNLMTRGGGGGTDAHLLVNMQSVPNQHNSREGALALLDMTKQVAAQTQNLRNATRGLVGDQLEMARNAFFADPRNQIKNPITGNPIAQDVAQQSKAAPAGGPPVGSTHNGYKFKGGNPNDKSSWEKL